MGKALLKGSADQLNSAFHLTYNMVGVIVRTLVSISYGCAQVLNLLRVEDLTPDIMIERSFFQFQNNSSSSVSYDYQLTHMPLQQSRKLRPS